MTGVRVSNRRIYGFRPSGFGVYSGPVYSGSEDPFPWRGLGEKKRPPSGGHRFDKGIDRLYGMCCGYFAAYYLLAAEIAVLVWRCLRTGCGRAFFAVILSANLLKHIRPFESWKLADIREWP